MSTTPATDIKVDKEQQRELYKSRSATFKGSIAVMVIYGTFILGLAMIGILSPSGREFIFEQNFAFTATFIGGTLLVITLLLVQLLTYSTPKKSIIKTDNLSCPDYWELKKTTPAMKAVLSSEIKDFANYYCEPSSGLVGVNTSLLGVNTTIPGVVGINTSTNSKFTDMITKFNYTGGVVPEPTPTTYAAFTSGLVGAGTTVAMKCNRIYPEYMDYMDNKLYPDKPNTLRCTFLDVCDNGTNKTNWTSVCPSS